MAIKSLQNWSRPALPRLGKLRKGGKKPARGLGQDLTYFRFTSDDGDAELEQVFRAAYGDEPAALRVFLPCADVASNFGAWLEQWAGGRLIHRCDGECCVRWLGDDGRYAHDPEMTRRKPCPFRDKPDAPNRCKEVGRLQLILPKLWEAGYAGLVTLETHSVNDIVHIESVLRHTLEHSIAREIGLRGIEFVLRRTPQRISRPAKDGGSIPTTKWLVKIEPTSEWLLAQLEMARHEQLGRRRTAAPVESEPARPDPEGVVEPQEDAPSQETTEPEAEGSATTRAEVHDVPTSTEGASPCGETGVAAWLSDKAKVGELLVLAKRERLTKDDVLGALGVERLGQITYDLDVAKERILRWHRQEERAVADEEVPF